MHSQPPRAHQAALMISALLFVAFLLPLLPALPQLTFLPGRTLDTSIDRPLETDSIQDLDLAILDLAIKTLLLLLLVGLVALLFRVSSPVVWRTGLLLLLVVGVGVLLLLLTRDNAGDEAVPRLPPPPPALCPMRMTPNRRSKTSLRLWRMWTSGSPLPHGICSWRS